MADSETHDGNYWRSKAQEKHAWASSLYSLDEQLAQQIIDSYELLARCAETMERSKRLLGSD
jgi:hypothetical protein